MKSGLKITNSCPPINFGAFFLLLFWHAFGYECFLLFSQGFKIWFLWSAILLLVFCIVFKMEVLCLQSSDFYMCFYFQIQCLLASIACQTLRVTSFWRATGCTSWLWMGLALSQAQSSRLLEWNIFIYRFINFDFHVRWLISVSWLCIQVRYKNDCEELFGRILDYSNVASSVEGGICIRQSQEIWNKLYPDEPYDFDLTRALSTGPNWKFFPVEKYTKYDLVSAVKRQSPFYYQVCCCLLILINFGFLINQISSILLV